MSGTRMTTNSAYIYFLVMFPDPYFYFLFVSRSCYARGRHDENAGRLRFLFSAHRLIMSYICNILHGNSLYGFNNTDETFQNYTLQRGIIL